ncbi:Matrix-remodeling-associated protein 7 [Lemmus lemmus]
MEAPAELLAALPALATALALLLAWLLLRRGAAPAPERSSPTEAPGAPAPPAPPEPSASEPAPAGPPCQPERMEEPGEPAAEEPADEGRKDEEQDSDSETGLPTEEPEEEDGAAFSFKYSPGQLRGSQYKRMMTKEELEEEQRIELTSDLTSL